MLKLYALGFMFRIYDVLQVSGRISGPKLRPSVGPNSPLRRVYNSNCAFKESDRTFADLARPKVYSYQDYKALSGSKGLKVGGA